MNNSILRDGGFKYYSYGQGAGGKKYWKCNQYYRTFCLAKVTTNGGRIISRYEQHNHNSGAAPINIKGKNTLKLRERDFTYRCNGQTARGTIYWRCKEFGRMQCPARVKTNGNQVILSRSEEHNHNPDGAPKVDTETWEAGTSTTDAPEPPGSGSQNETFRCYVKNALKLLREGGFTYCSDVQNASGTIYWRCKEFRRMQCPARVKTNRNQVILFRSNEHNHPGDATTKIDAEIRKAATSTTDDATKPSRNGSQDKTTPVMNKIDKPSSQCPNVDQNCYSPSGHTKPLATAVMGSMMNGNTEATSSHVSHTTYAQWPGQAGADQDEQLDLRNLALDAREDAQINVEANVRQVTFTPLCSDSTVSSLYKKLQTIYEYLQTNTEDDKPIMPDERE